MRYTQISESDLKDILLSLQDEPSFPGDGISAVRDFVNVMLYQIEREYAEKEKQNKVLTMKDMEMYKKYKLVSDDRVAEEFRGQELEVVAIKSVKVEAILVSRVGKHAPGTMFMLYPDLLEEI